MSRRHRRPRADDDAEVGFVGFAVAADPDPAPAPARRLRIALVEFAAAGAGFGYRRGPGAWVDLDEVLAPGVTVADVVKPEWLAEPPKE